MNLIKLASNQDETYTIIGFDKRFSVSEVENLVKEIWHLAKNSKCEGTVVKQFNHIMRQIPGITVFDNANLKTVYV